MKMIPYPAPPAIPERFYTEAEVAEEPMTATKKKKPVVLGRTETEDDVLKDMERLVREIEKTHRRKMRFR